MSALQAAARRDSVRLVAAFVGYSVFYGTFFLQSFLSGNYIAPSDSLDFGVADYLSPPTYWTDGMYSGYPIAADPQSLTWYPVMQVFRAIGADWNLFLIAAYVIASATCFLLVRRLTGSSLAGAFSGFVCGFSALMLGYIANFNQIHAFAWVPLVLYGLQLIREGLYRQGAAVTAASTALMWLAGHPQVPVYAMYVAAAVIGGSLVVDGVDKATTWRRLRWSAFALALGFTLAAIEIVPMLELSRFSGRADSSFELYASSALPPRELLTLVAPFAFGGFWTPSAALPYVGETGDSAYIGLLPVVLVLAAPVAAHKYRREARLWAAIAIFEILLSLGAATPVGRLFFYAPGFSVFQAPLRHLFFVSLCLAVAAGLAFAGLIDRRESPRSVPAAAAITAIVAAVAVGLLMRNAPAVRPLMEGPGNYERWAIGWPLLICGLLAGLVVVARMLPHRRGGVVALAVLLIVVQIADLAALHYRLPGQAARGAESDGRACARRRWQPEPVSSAEPYTRVGNPGGQRDGLAGHSAVCRNHGDGSVRRYCTRRVVDRPSRNRSVCRRLRARARGFPAVGRADAAARSVAATRESPLLRQRSGYVLRLVEKPASPASCLVRASGAAGRIGGGAQDHSYRTPRGW